MKKVLYLLMCSALFSLTGCDNFDDYYFKLENFETPKYYHYQDVTDSTNHYYWKISSYVDADSLVTETFNQKFEKTELFIEKFDRQGSLLITFDRFSNGDTLESLYEDGYVYQWYERRPYSYRMDHVDKNHKDVHETSTYEYLSEDSILIMGKMLGSIQYKCEYISRRDQEEFATSSINYYTQEYGLVKYIRESDRDSSTIELIEILTETEWEERSGKDDNQIP